MKFLAAIVLVAAANASAQNVSVTIDGRIAPGVYGSVTIGNPRVYAPQPVVIVPMPIAQPPIYLYVPPGHRQNWSRHCHRYDACGRQVYFVREDWVQERYREHERPGHGHGRGNHKHN